MGLPIAGSQVDSDLDIRRLPVYLLLDTSGSMVGSKIEAVNDGLRHLLDALLADSRMRDMAFVSLITFGSTAVQHPLTAVSQLVPPTLQASGQTAMGAAIHLLVESIRNDVRTPGPDRKGDYRPLAFLFTDGAPTDDTSQPLAELSALKSSLRPTIWAFGFGADVDLSILRRLTPNVFSLPSPTSGEIVACLTWVVSNISMLVNSVSVSHRLQMRYPTEIPGLILVGAEDLNNSSVTNDAVASVGESAVTSAPAAPRTGELLHLEETNVSAGRAPYDGVRIVSKAELNWILHSHKWSGDLYSVESHADLRGAVLNGVDLSGIRLARADLSRARLAGAVLVNADLVDAQLVSADLVDADCTGADFSNADLTAAKLEKAVLREATLAATNLTGARLIGTDARGADARMAILRGAILRNVDLSGANLREVVVDRATRLIDPVVNTQTCLGDIQFADIPLTRVGWEQIPRLGDERVILDAKRHVQGDTVSLALTTAAAYRVAARAYRGLSIALRGQGMLVAASNYRLREQVLERKALLREGRLVAWIFSWLLHVLAGYGERPARSFAAYLLVVFGFTAAYYGIGSGMLGVGVHDAISTPLQALVFSVTSFHGRGFFPGGLSLDDPLTVLAAIEAVIGLFIEITFIATFTQRFFAR